MGLSINRQSFNKQLSGIAGGAEKSVMSAFKPLGKMIGTVLGGAAIVSFTKSCLSLGSDLQEVQNVVDVTFGSMSSAVNGFAKNAMTQFGLSETAAKKYTGTFGAMSKAMGLSKSAAYEMSTAVTGLTGDAASFYNLSADEAYTKLKSIWTGETETLKDLGVVMTQTALDQYALNNGFGKTTKSMTEQEKLMLRYQYVMSSLSGAQGDFARTSDSWANQTRVLSLQFESLKATLGKGFINLFTPIIKALNSLLSKLQILAEAFSSFTEGLMGKTSIEQSVSGGVSEVAALGTGFSDAGNEAVTAAQKAKKAFAGFDEINTLGVSATSGADALGGISSGGVDLSGLSEAGTAADGIASEMGAKLREAISSAGTHFRAVFSSLKKWGKINFAPIFNGIFNGLAKNGANLAEILKGMFYDIQSLGEPLKAYFAGDFTVFLQTVFTNLGIILNGLYESFNMIFGSIWSLAVFPILENFVVVGLPMFTQFITECINTLGIFFTEIKLIFDTLWTEAVAPFISLFSEMWCDLMLTLSEFWNKWGKPIFDGINEALKTMGETFLNVWEEFLKPVFDKIMNVLDELWNEHIQSFVAKLLDCLGTIVDWALTFYNDFIAPIVNWLIDTLGPIFSEVFGDIYDCVGDTLGGIFDALGGLLDFITGVFSGDWEKAWNGIKDFFAGIWDAIWGIVKGVVNLIIDGINLLWEGIYTVVSAIVNAVGGVAGAIGDLFGCDWEFSMPAEPPLIPKLAKGGLAYQPTLAMVGDNKNARSDPEVIAPLSKLEGIMGQGGNDRVYEILVKIYELLRQLQLTAQFNLDGRMLEEVIVSLITKNSFITNGR